MYLIILIFLGAFKGCLVKGCIDAILQAHVIEHVIFQMNKNISFTNFMGWSGPRNKKFSWSGLIAVTRIDRIAKRFFYLFETNKCFAKLQPIPTWTYKFVILCLISVQLQFYILVWTISTKCIHYKLTIKCTHGANQ